MSDILERYLDNLESKLEERLGDITKDIDFYDTRIIDYSSKGFEYDWNITNNGLQLTVTFKFDYKVIDQNSDIHEFNYIGTHRTTDLNYTDIAIELLGELENIIDRNMIKGE